MYKTSKDLEKALDVIKASPKEKGEINLIVCRPAVGERQVLERAELDIQVGLVGDNWQTRGFKRRSDGSAHPDMQINIMNSRVIAAISESKSQWPLAGDQFYVDFDLSDDNLPPGTRLSLGTAELEVTAEPHLGCKKFKDRFGKGAVLFVNSNKGKALNLRGINAKVIRAGRVAVGDTIKKTQ